MSEQFSRTAMLLGQEAIATLSRCHVAVFGLGGVGGYTVEALARAGIGSLTLVDNDSISITNLNRQLFATHSTVGQQKTAVAAKRVADINPTCSVHTHDIFYLPETANAFDLTQYDYIIDAVDTVTAKLTLIQNAVAAGTPIISCMGTGNKLDAAKLQITDIQKTAICPLARIMRKELGLRGIRHLPVLWSAEDPLTPTGCHEAPTGSRRSIPGSVPWVPSVAGLLLAGHVVQALVDKTGGKTPC